MTDLTAPTVTAVVALGMGLAFFGTDPRSPTSRALSLALVFVGLSIASDVYFVKGRPPGTVNPWFVVSPVLNVVAFCAAFEWILRVRRTIAAGELATRFGDGALRAAQALVVLYGVLGVLFPVRRAQEFIGAIVEPDLPATVGFYMFTVPLELAMLLAGVSAVLVLNRRPDRAERFRLIAVCIAIPVTASGLVLSAEVAPIVSVLGLLIMLAGALQYHVLQGERGLFLGRFLSPQVAGLVRARGLRSVLLDHNVELSVVSCDLRNFTAFAEATDSEDLIRFLREYYDAVGEAVARHGGTIKDYTGDGVLVLVGAPLAMADHARRAVELAQRMAEATRAVIARWGHPEGLGVGLGVASGQVTVGVVGGVGRLEYAAVGPTVNLASRLCDLAAPDEVLVAQRTVELMGGTGAVGALEPRAPVTLKGFPEAVENFALRQAA